MFQVRELLEKVTTEKKAFEVLISEISPNWNKLVHCCLSVFIE